MGERGPSVLARTRVALGLLAGLRGHDFHAAWTFMHMTWPHDAAPVRLLKFAGWTLRQMFSIIPDALATVSFADRPSPHEGDVGREQRGALRAGHLQGRDTHSLRDQRDRVVHHRGHVRLRVRRALQRRPARGPTYPGARRAGRLPSRVFRPSRVLDPEHHPWPEIEGG